MPNKKYFGHSAHVADVAFTKGGDYLISVGGMDGCVFQVNEQKHRKCNINIIYK